MSKKNPEIENPVVLVPVADGTQGISRRYSTTGINQIAPFVDLIRSLEFDVEHKGLEQAIKINGIDFTINAHNGHETAWLQFQRRYEKRKPENRFMKLERGWGHTVIKVQFNKTYDANKLRAKINAEIKAHHDLIKSRADAELENETRTIDIANKLVMAHGELSKLVKYLYIRKGEISFRLSNVAELTVDTELQSIKFTIFERELQSPSSEVIHDTLQKTKDVSRVYSILFLWLKECKLTNEEKAWAKNNTEQFNCENNEYYKH